MLKDQVAMIRHYVSKKLEVYDESVRKQFLHFDSYIC
nr:MAG TPA_asm: hypothetical protein [Caudoviricetes sp.]